MVCFITCFSRPVQIVWYVKNRAVYLGQMAVTIHVCYLVTPKNVRHAVR